MPSPIAARCKHSGGDLTPGANGRKVGGSIGVIRGVWGDQSTKWMPLELQNRGSQHVQDVLSGVVGMAAIWWALDVPLSSWLALLVSSLVHVGRCLVPRSKMPDCTRTGATTATPHTGTPAPAFAGWQWVNETTRPAILPPKWENSSKDTAPPTSDLLSSPVPYFSHPSGAPFLCDGEFSWDKVFCLTYLYFELYKYENEFGFYCPVCTSNSQALVTGSLAAQRFIHSHAISFLE